MDGVFYYLLSQKEGIVSCEDESHDAAYVLPCEEVGRLFRAIDKQVVLKNLPEIFVHAPKITHKSIYNYPLIFIPEKVNDMMIT